MAEITILVPDTYSALYDQVTELMTQNGYDMLQDCMACCKNKNIQIWRIYNMLQSGLAAYNNSQQQLANLIFADVQYRVNKLIDNSNTN